MPAYAIVFRETPLRDADSQSEYSASNRANAALFQGEYGLKPLAVYGAMQALEGEAPDGIVLIEFPTMDHACRWYDSEEYQRVIPLREKAADWRVILVQGLG